MSGDESRVEWEKAGWLLIDSYATTAVQELRSTFFRQEDSGVLHDLDARQVVDYPILVRLRDFALEFGARVGYQGLTLHKVWAQRTELDWAQTQLSKVPFEPHIDYQRYLKMMFYVSNVTESDGPMAIARCNPRNFEQFRRSLPQDYKQRRLNVVETDRSVMTLVTAPAGSVLFFDTNVPHQATAPTAEGVREILRFDLWCPDWKGLQDLSLSKRLLSAVTRQNRELEL